MSGMDAKYGFQEHLYTYLVEQGQVNEEETSVEDITLDFVYGETDLEEADVRDIWNGYVKECEEDAATPINDVEGWVD